jgi:16S rRNA (adenine1518-N6/adenine1519-N6)-dimethyltransferase
LAHLPTPGRQTVLAQSFTPTPDARMPSRAPFRPKQSLGQNFLQDPNMADKIARTLTVSADAPVVEVGAGTGALTEALLDRYERLVAIEIDERAVAVLHDAYPDLDVRQEDVRDTDWAALADAMGGPLAVISNTPYYLTTEILFALVAARAHVTEAVLTMQHAVAKRLVAEPRTKAYGVLSVITQLYGAPELCFKVPPQVFSPQPDVSSAVVRLQFGPPSEALAGVDDDWLRTVVRTAFNQRRKMLRNSLSTWAKEQDVTLPNDWGRRRAEALRPEDFVTLARYLDAHADRAA